MMNLPGFGLVFNLFRGLEDLRITFYPNFYRWRPIVQAVDELWV